jgi:hypothetical protein
MAAAGFEHSTSTLAIASHSRNQRHIIFDHLLRDVKMWHEPISWYRRIGFFVDVHGILRVRDRGRRKPKRAGQAMA